MLNVAEVPKNVSISSIDQAINWARKNSLAFLPLDLSCCGVELLQTTGGRFDIERFGAYEQRIPELADLMIVAGNVSKKAAPRVLELYRSMPNPPYVMSIGSCSNSGGPFIENGGYATIAGVGTIIPVDVYVPGCPPRPEAILHGLIELQKMIEARGFEKTSSRGLG